MCTTAPTATPATRQAGADRRFARIAQALCLALLAALQLRAQNGDVTSFRVKYVAPGAVYLAGGRNAGLEPGQHLTIRRASQTRQSEEVAQLAVLSVASASAVCDVLSSLGEIQPGDIAYLSAADVQKMQDARASKTASKYPQIVSFSEGDPLDEELRESVPRPPLPEINRARGRFGFDYSAITDPRHERGPSTQTGFVLRADMTRLGGTYWNLSGYYRGRISSRKPSESDSTLTDLINRTYHLSLTYDSPASDWVAGFGRFYLPWAASLNTIDGGYLGRRVAKGTTLGLFGGSAPDPTSWSYDPNRQMTGAFANFEGGDFESFKFTSTVGMALTRVHWHPDRQFGFFENGLFYKRYLSVYHNLEADLLRGDQGGSGLAASRSYLTVRVQPSARVSFDISHNYFRDIPTFDERLIGTGLVDKLLFQGLSAGMRFELPYRISPYFSLGRSDRTGDAKTSWNQMYGVTVGRIWRTGVRGDVRYTKFDSAFGSGNYRSITASRDVGERFRFDLQAGDQHMASLLTRETRARWINGNSDWFPTRHYFLGLGFTIYRSKVQDYNQWYMNLGYRF